MSDFISTDVLLYFFDMLGVMACAIAGTLLAQHKGFDVSGCILVAMVNAIGGGTIRDVVLDRHPLFWMMDLTYVVVITVTSLIVQVFFHLSHKIDKPLTFFDAIGLATFSVIGFKVGLAQGAVPVIAILMGICTAIVGGMLRDMICNELPLVLRREIYITASLIGALVYLALDALGSPTLVNEFMMLGVIFSIRMLAVHFDWHLPSIRLVR